MFKTMLQAAVSSICSPNWIPRPSVSLHDPLVLQSRGAFPHHKHSSSFILRSRTAIWHFVTERYHDIVLFLNRQNPALRKLIIFKFPHKQSVRQSVCYNGLSGVLKPLGWVPFATVPIQRHILLFQHQYYWQVHLKLQSVPRSKQTTSLL